MSGIREGQKKGGRNQGPDTPRPTIKPPGQKRGAPNLISRSVRELEDNHYRLHGIVNEIIATLIVNIERSPDLPLRALKESTEKWQARYEAQKEFYLNPPEEGA